ncbi:hypothetical protein BG005_002753 [Podila minutissima]|nr:hypothetical protein BG005_002753 [Podila minutissima]
MTVTKFNLTVKSTSKNVERLMIILNPSLIAPTGKIYETYYPVAWNVLEFTSNKDGERTPQPGIVKFEVSLTAILQKIISGNIVQTGSYQQVHEGGDVFEIQLDEDLPDLVKSKERREDFTATIYNTQQDPYYVGLGDKDGNSYLTMQAKSGIAIGFKYTPEFAVVPIGKTVQGSKFTTGTALKPWFSFMLDDVTDTAPSFTYDGMNLTNLSGISVTNHTAIEPVFGSGPKEI